MDRVLAKTRRRFRAGTTGWTASDLDDPQIDRLWEQGRYEIVEGVLTRMPAAYYDPAIALTRLIRILRTAIEATDPGAEIPTEVDVIVGELRVPKVDALYLSPADRQAQKQANARLARGYRKKLTYGRILVPPTLIIESLSRGHEDHDRVTKRNWFAQMKVPNYWLLNSSDRSLQCLVLENDDYRVDASGRGKQEIRPRLFPSLVIPLATLWADQDAG
jgi:Uma2 family endonuclease